MLLASRHPAEGRLVQSLPQLLLHVPAGLPGDLTGVQRRMQLEEERFALLQGRRSAKNVAQLFKLFIPSFAVGIHKSLTDIFFYCIPYGNLLASI
ncbi:hypothetical protein SDC9_79758 [bioreactor metagenome]|uniref:Uncharacterized protein n=1 Tax=bioreactor metagenome TaxID=1076179 RepID=A0A644YY07_9ZZZZ